MPDISSLSQDVQTFTSRLNLVNTAYVIFLALTLIASTLIIWYGNKLNKAKDGLSIHEKLVSDEQIARLTAEAEKARADIAGAQAEAAKANERTQELERHNLTLSKEVAILQKDTAEAQGRQAEAERALLELQERVRPRSLTSEQQTRFVEALQAGPLGKIDISCPMNDPEAFAFAQEIALLLKTAGWDAQGVSRSLYTGSPKGIFIVVQSGDNRPAASLQKAFHLIGLEAAGELQETVPRDEIRLVIGHKP